MKEQNLLTLNYKIYWLHTVFSIKSKINLLETVHFFHEKPKLLAIDRKLLNILCGCTVGLCAFVVQASCSNKVRPAVIKLFPCSTQLSMKFILLINVKMPTLVGTLTFTRKINTTSERQARNFFICLYFSFYEQLKFRAQLS